MVLGEELETLKLVEKERERRDDWLMVDG